MSDKLGKKEQKRWSRLGKRIASVRLQLNMSQPNFAKWLSVETRKEISSLMLCRMENYGARDACHPIKPDPAIVEIVESVGRRSEEVKETLQHYQSLHLMEQPGDTLVKKMLNAYRVNDMLPLKLKDMNDEEILQQLGIEDTDIREGESVE